MNFDFMRRRKLWYIISLVIIGIGLITLMFKGLNLGIDFKGGTILHYRFQEQVSPAEVRQVLGEMGLAEKSVIQRAEEGGFPGILIRTDYLGAEQKDELRIKLQERFPSFMEEVRSNVVGPTIGKELRVKALYALVLASIALIIYISYRFEFKYAIASIVALIHDVLIVVGFFAILGKEVDTAFVAALLTIVGYSINDTIVVFDRIRENLKFADSREKFIDIANQAIYDTLPRSINTSLTTLITVLAIYFLGGATLKTFMLALFIGFLAGTYSSIFIASPLLQTWEVIFSKNK